MPRPNLLILHTDQQSCWTLSCYGGDDTRVDTPNIDRLAVEGARLDAFYCTSAVCTPSRGCFLTGRYPHAHGAFANNRPLHADEVTFATSLRDAGWRTGYLGKWHLDGAGEAPGWIPPERAFGFEDSRFMWHRGHPNSLVDEGGPQPRFSGDPEEGRYTTDWLTDRAVEWLDAATAGDAPFCLMVSYPDPHTPYAVREPYASRFDPEAITVPETFGDRDVPDWVAATRERYAPVFGNGIDDPEREANLRRHKAAYCGMVACLDDNVGRLLQHLESLGALDDTIVLYTSDHGDFMGEHGLFGKGGPYESAFRVPGLVRWPAAIPAGLTVGTPIAQVDWLPTLLSLAGVPGAGREQGDDASALLRGELAEGFGIVHGHHQSLTRANVFTRDWNLALAANGGGLLFDRHVDPGERHNLFGDGVHDEIVLELTAKVAEHHAAVEAPSAMWTRIVAGQLQDLKRQGKPLAPPYTGGEGGA